MTDAPTSPSPSSPPDRGDTSFGSAVAWSYVMDGSRVLMSLLVTLVLARVLGPEVYGTAAFAIVFTLLVRLVVQNGMVAAIIQREQLENRHLQAAFVMVLVVASLLTVVTVAAAPLLGELTDDPDLAEVLQVLSLMVIIGGLAVVPEGIQRRQLNFKILAVRTSVAVLVGSVTALVAAALGAGVWAIVLQQLATEAVALVLLWFVTPWRPTWSFDRDAAGDLLGFWSGTVLASLGSYLRWQIDILLIGGFFPRQTVGLYRFGQRLPDQWSELSVRALQNASLPELAKYQDDEQRFRERVIDVVRLSAIVGIPVLGVLAGLAEPLIDLVDATKWADAETAVTVLSLATALKALTLFSAPVLQAIGRTYTLAALTWFHAAVGLVVFVSVGLWLGDSATSVADQVLGTAWSRVVVFFVAVLVDSIVISRLTALHVTDVARAAAPSAAVGLLAFTATSLVLALLGDLPALVVLVVAGGAGLFTVIVGLLALEPLVRRQIVRVPVLGPRLAGRIELQDTEV
ncbi:MAG: lipopolysaccharide biosynthesis protein [Acidimicrobiia bacterium]|nr:lipopolysaccharide biosynthesis protein [Acidimicrobiia bacterium]